MFTFLIQTALSKLSSSLLMDLKLTLSCILLSCLFPLIIADDVKVTIKGATLIARTDDNFICATLDWWPSEKCDYNQCPWGEAGLFNLVFLLFSLLKSPHSFRHEHAYICVCVIKLVTRKLTFSFI